MATTIVNGAIAVHHTATVDTSWDGPAAVAAMPNDAAVLEYCHAWQDANGKPDAKSSWKLPHHLKEGGPANMAACRNGLARLANTDIPAADKPGVERHLKAHLSDGGSDEETEDHVHSHLMNGPVTVQPPSERHLKAQSCAREWFTIRNAADDGSAQVYIYDEIGQGWFGGGVNASDFVTALADLKASAIDLHINSPGGDVFDAIAIYNALRRHPANVTSYIDGLAASAASFIAQAGNKVVVERNAQFMVHDALGMCLGNAADMMKMTDLLNKASDNIADIYSQRSGVDQSTWRAVMQAEAWYSSSEAVIAGLADEVGQGAAEPDGQLTATARFGPTLKALGARYGSRGEAPDPALIPAASTRAQRSSGARQVSVTQSIAPLRRDTLSAAHVVMEPAPVEIPVATAPIVMPQTVETKAAEPHETQFESVFDPAAFRIAVRAGLAAHR